MNGETSRPPRGGVDRNRRIRLNATPKRGRPPRGGVDRNMRYTAEEKAKDVAPHAGAWIETILRHRLS